MEVHILYLKRSRNAPRDDQIFLGGKLAIVLGKQIIRNPDTTLGLSGVLIGFNGTPRLRVRGTWMIWWRTVTPPMEKAGGFAIEVVDSHDYDFV